MALLIAGDIRFDAGLVVFDKDGTLLHFDAMWGSLLIGAVEALAPHTQQGAALAADLFRAMGYDPARRWTDPHGPWAMATTEQGLTILSATLYRHGQPWHLAEAAVRHAWQSVLAPGAQPGALSGLVSPTTDLVAFFTALRRAGARVAVDTTDDRAATEATLRLLNVDQLVDRLICGDDGLPGKPAAERLLATCQALDVPVARTVMVGDTVFDLLMGRRAGAGLVVGVLTGASDRATLAAHADIVLDSVAQIEVAES